MASDLDRRLLDPRVLAAIDQSSTTDDIPFRARTTHLHSTWAGTFTSLPELYIQPETLQEVEHVVNLARRCRRRVTTVGCGHSPSDLTCTSSWLVNLDRFNRVLAIDPATGVVTMEAGIRLYTLCEELDRHGLAMTNLGSINEQSMAGVISTGTHGSSLRHGLLSEDILSLKITLADGRTRACSATDDPDLFRAALLSLGALGIITEVTFRAVPAYSLRWRQTVDADKVVLGAWGRGLWTQAAFVRVWWFPYTRRAVTWTADVVDTAVVPHRDPQVSYYDGAMGYYVYHNLLHLARWVPSILPWVEWFVFGMQYGFRNGSSISAVQPSRKALLMNCLYSQYVNEWALPLHRGPEALLRLGSWLQRLKPGDGGYVDHGIPFTADGLYVHAPVEVRVADSTLRTSAAGGTRPFLDPTQRDGPTLYLNAIMYRPYHADPPGTERYYRAFEWLMRDLGGRPHWAKNFLAGAKEVEAAYGEDLAAWRRVRDEADPEGMFVGPWHRRVVLGGGGDGAKLLPLEEQEIERAGEVGGGVRVQGVVEDNRLSVKG